MSCAKSLERFPTARLRVRAMQLELRMSPGLSGELW